MLFPQFPFQSTKTSVMLYDSSGRKEKKNKKKIKENKTAVHIEQA